MLAVFLLPWPWNFVAVVSAALWETATAIAGYRYSQRGMPRVGAETLVGRPATVVTPCRPVGQVKVQGEIWEARCAAGAGVGERVLVRAVDGLTLIVEPVART